MINNMFNILNCIKHMSNRNINYEKYFFPGCRYDRKKINGNAAKLFYY